MAIDVTDMLADPNFAPKAWQVSTAPKTRGGWSKPPVGDSLDLRRILQLPRRDVVVPGSVKSEALIQHMTDRYRVDRGPCRCVQIIRERGAAPRPCITRLRHAQAWALFEMAIEGGLLGPIGVGHGKTLLDILAPIAIPNTRVALLLVKPSLLDQLIAEYRLVAQHWRVPQLVVHGRDFATPQTNEPVLHALSYNKLSRPEATAFMSALAPDLVISDELQYLRHPDTATTSRVLRRFAAAPSTRFVGWSGSMTEASIKDYAHLSTMALQLKSPLPIDPETVSDWARALDASDSPAPAGALFALCRDGEHVRDGFRRRLNETRGVVSAYEPAIDAELQITEREAPDVPQVILDALDDLRCADIRPDGADVADPFEKYRIAIQLACGFYYRWKFPRGEPLGVRLTWLSTRREWYAELRKKLGSRAEHMDSEKLCTLAAMRGWGDIPNEHNLPEWKPRSWPEWQRVKPTVVVETEPVFLDDYLARDAATWALNNRGIVWYQHAAFGTWVAKLSGLPLHGGGPGAGERLAKETGARSIVASLKAHGTGRDGLQHIYDDQLVANPPPSAQMWEQMLGRLHREGQRSACVRARYYAHTNELRRLVATALNRADYLAETTGAQQKIGASIKLE